MTINKMKKESKKNLTNSATQLDVVMLAVYLLGGNKKSVDTEDVAIKCHELAPGIFSWRKYKGQINLELVRVNLSNAKKLDYGKMLSGSGREGWRLSSHGVEWVSSQGKALLKKGHIELNSARLNAGSVDTVRKKREKTRLLLSTAWKTWNKDKPISIRDARNLFRIDEYATGKMLEIKIVRLLSLFEENKEIGPFVREAANLVLETKE